MDSIITSIVDFILGLDTTVRILLVGLFAMFGFMCFAKVVKQHINAAKFKFRIAPIIFTVIFIGIAVFIATV